MSGAADVILQLTDDADDSDFPHVYVVSTTFAHILKVNLLLNVEKATCCNNPIFLSCKVLLRAIREDHKNETDSWFAIKNERLDFAFDAKNRS